MRIRSTSLLLGLVLFAATTPGQAQQRFDVLIRGGRVLDGSGSPWRYADVGIRGDRIAAVGDLSGDSAASVIDARGLYIAPGFIDVHSHAAPGLATPGLSDAKPLIAEGITTLFGNPNGGGPVDLAKQREALMKDGLGVNIGLLIGQGSVREAVIGPDDRPPTSQEMERMKELVRGAMKQGAFGLSSGLFYTPGGFAATEEVIELAKQVAPFGGLYTSHIRDESDYTVGVVAAVDEVIRVAREAKIPGVVTHIKVLGPHVWGYSEPIVEHIDRARAEGVEMWADQYPYAASSTSLEAALVPAWARDGGDSAMVRRFDDPALKDSVRAGMRDGLDRRGGADRLQIARYKPDASLEGKTLAQIAESRGGDAIETAIALLRKGGASVVSFNMQESDIARFMREPWTMTCSDGDLVPFGVGVPHPRAYGTFPRKIRKYVIEDRVIGLAAAIHSMTGLPASVFRLKDRGELREGTYADIVVFDLAKVDDPATFTEPHQLAKGMVDVLVNGRFAIRDGKLTGEKAGVVLRR